MSSDISKQEYLKRYLENDKDSDRKRKKKTKSVKLKANVPRLKIIDQDIDLKSINFGDKEVEDDGDEAPVIAEIIDERPIEEKIKELYESSRWKKVNSDENSQTSSTVISEIKDSKSGLGSVNQHLSTEKRDLASIGQNNSKTVQQDFEDGMSSRNKESRSKKRHDSDIDISPLRSQKRLSDSDISPPRSHRDNQDKTDIKHRFDSDISSSQSHKYNRTNAKHGSDSDISPPRSHKRNRTNAKHGNDSDISPPRSHKRDRTNAKHGNDSNISSLHHKSTSVSISKIKFKRHDSSSDISPQRHETINKSKYQVKTSSKRHDSDSDISPPRHKTIAEFNQIKVSAKKYDSDSDISPTRQQTENKLKSNGKSSSKKYSSHNNTSLQYQNHSPRMGNSKNRKDQNSDSDLSPPRSSSRLSINKDKNKKLDKTLSGLKAGLQNSETLQQEIQEMKKRERSMLNTIDEEMSGKNADTILRDRKTGMKRDLNKEKEDKMEENRKTKEYEQKYSRWGKGVEQSEDKLEKFKDDLYEMSKPLARYRDDEDLDERLKSIIHDEDPMSEYIKKKKRKDMPSVPLYSGPLAPPNRFGILPGYRWDGVERSNGFEKKYFEKINSTKAVQDEAYMWSVQEM